MARTSTGGCLRDQSPKIILCFGNCLLVVDCLEMAATTYALFSSASDKDGVFPRASKPSCVGRSSSLFGPLTCSVTLAVTSSANVLRESTTHQRPLQARLITCGPYHIPLQAITSRLGRLHDLTGRTSSRGLPVYVLTTPSELLVLPQIRGPSPRPGDFCLPFCSLRAPSGACSLSSGL